MSTNLPNRLIVEGLSEKWVIPQLVEKLGVLWGGPKERDKWPAEIIVAGSVSEIIRPGYLSQEWKASGVKKLGVIVDADLNAANRWKQIYAIASSFLPSLSTQLPSEGMVHEHQDEEKRRFGVWIMPDNVSLGMLETFLAYCVPNHTQGLWPFIEKHCDDARILHNALYKDNHRDKALIHSWLALQNPPGQQLHSAIIEKTLVPSSPQAAVFLKWFCTLFDLPLPQ